MSEKYSLEAVKAAYGWGRSKSWNDAIELMGRAAAAGEDGAAQQLALVTQAPIEQMLTPPSPERMTPHARIAAARGFAPPGFGNWLIERARTSLQPSTTAGGQIDEKRTALTTFFKPRDADLVIAILQHRASILLSVPVECHEAPSVISYEVGQQYVAHFDFLDPNVERERENLARYGQRVGTVVTYLNDDFEGSATVFPRLDIAFRGQPGDAVFFANVRPDGQPDTLTLHQAPPPTRGRKWVFSQWIRSKRLSLAEDLQLL